MINLSGCKSQPKLLLVPEIKILTQSESNLLSWWSDPEQNEKILQFDQEGQALMRKGVEEKDFYSYTNTSRDDPLEYRYKGKERIAKLKGLKMKWDPKGILTKELL